MACSNCYCSLFGSKYYNPFGCLRTVSRNWSWRAELSGYWLLPLSHIMVMVTYSIHILSQNITTSLPTPPSYLGDYSYFVPKYFCNYFSTYSQNIAFIFCPKIFFSSYLGDYSWQTDWLPISSYIYRYLSVILVSFWCSTFFILVGEKISNMETSLTMKVDPQLCQICEEFATEALFYLNENETQVEIIATLHQACSKFPSFKLEVLAFCTNLQLQVFNLLLR